MQQILSAPPVIGYPFFFLLHTSLPCQSQSKSENPNRAWLGGGGDRRRRGLGGGRAGRGGAPRRRREMGQGQEGSSGHEINGRGSRGAGAGGASPSSRRWSVGKEQRAAAWGASGRWMEATAGGDDVVREGDVLERGGRR